jgi:tRNA(fMet)-specific endonuclease VapC
VTSIVNAEEQLRGWLAQINRQKTPRKQIPAYEKLQVLLRFLRPISLLAFDECAADEFDRLRRMKVRIGSADLKIACIALVHDAILLSANLRDFRQVPGLRLENWLNE